MKNLLFLIAFVASLNAQIPMIGSNVAPAGGGGSVSFVTGQSIAKQQGSATLSFSQNLPSPATVGNVIIYGLGGYLASGPAPFTIITDGDNQGNTGAYTSDGINASTGDTNVQSGIGHVTVASTGSPFTITATPNSGRSTYLTVAALEFHGLTGTIDGATTGAGGNSGSVACGSITTTAPNEVVVTTIQCYPATITIGAGMTAIFQDTASGSATTGIGYILVPTSGTTVSPTATLSASGSWSCTTAAYK